jgi:hypothetical protein
MPAFEIHVETYAVEFEIPVIEAKDAYEAAIMYAARWSPCKIRRIRETEQDDVFLVQPTDAVGDDGVEIEVFEHCAYGF